MYNYVLIILYDCGLAGILQDYTELL